MSRQQNRRQLSVQSLETRKLMAGDTFANVGSASLTDDGGFIEPFDAFSIPEAPPGLTITINGVNDPPSRALIDTDSVDAVMARSSTNDTGSDLLIVNNVDGSDFFESTEPTIDDITISDNTANLEGGGLWNDLKR